VKRFQTALQKLLKLVSNVPKIFLTARSYLAFIVSEVPLANSGL
jgi:hypothetical protein